MYRAIGLTVVALGASGCGLLYDPCGDLEERLCEDLGSDCETFRSTPEIREAVIPVRRRSAERSQCEMFAADVNYESYTLPFIRYLIASRRDPSTPAPNLPNPQPGGVSSAFSSWFYCCVPFVLIPVLIFVGWRARRNLAAMQGAGAPASFGGPPAAGGAPPGASAAGPIPAGPAPGGTATWSHVDSREKAEAQVHAGALVMSELFPAFLGGQAVPENVVFLPPQAAERKAALDREVWERRNRGESLHYAVEPRYQGASFVPASLAVTAGDRVWTIEVW